MSWQSWWLLERFVGTGGRATVARITLDGDSLKEEVYWSGQSELIPDSITFIDIEWHNIDDLSALDNRTTHGPGEAVSSEPSNID